MKALPYRPEIDGLRCLAVLAVIGFHADFPGFGGGFVGVDVFYVISGYLITSIIHPEVREQRFSFTRFYERRVRRLFPALFAMLALVTIAAFLMLTPAQLRDYGQSLVAVSTFLSNLYFEAKTGYFGRNGDEVPLLHTWSLSVEEQFYLAFPITLIALVRWVPRRVGSALVLLLAASLALCLWREQTLRSTLNFFDATSRAWELLLGAVLAVREIERADSDAPAVRGHGTGALLGLALVLLPVALFSRQGSHPGQLTLLPVAGTGLLLACARSDHTWVARMLSQRALVHIGLISYSAYLWHQPLFALSIAHLGHALPVAVKVGLVLLCLAIAHASWRFVERPFRDRARTSARTVWIGAAVGTMVLLVVGLTLHFSGGVPARFAAAQARMKASAIGSPTRVQCHTEGVNYLKPKDGCRLFDAQNVHWATLGDSHTVELAYGLAVRLRERGLGGVHFLSNSGCQPALNFDSDVPGCSAWLREALAWLESEPSIDHVALLWRHSYYLYGDPRLTFPAVPDERPNFLRALAPDAARQSYVDNLRAIVERLRAAGKTVVLLDPIPELQRPVEFNIYSPALLDDPAHRADGPSRAFYEQRNAFILRELAGLGALPGVVRVPTADVVCNGARCFALDGEQALYFDDNHLSVTGALRLADLVLARSAQRP